ncbi:LADA_0B08218g1_1 [Lachancea dasiensis]|uniref:LADA_0B08218g1_1 n=1 Tax=Lachancea dasiensis TaxID=1072105 RepID=A0A1G4IUE0_9SACH|nr:LADA_0B08218g1_1 [Lachancea dasiensis]
MTSNVSIWDDKIHIIYVVELVFYSGLLCSTVGALLRGRHRPKAFYLTALSVLKIAGLAISLDAAVKSVNATNNDKLSDMPSLGLVTTGAILISIATTPLLYVTQAFCFPEDLFKAIPRAAIAPRLMVLLPAILSIVGYDYWSTKGSHSTTGLTLVRASSIIFLATYLIFLLVGAVSSFKSRRNCDTSRDLGVMIVLLACPFFLVRFVYTILSAFELSTDTSAYHKFNTFNGDWRLYLGMFVVMEFMVELIYVIGLHLIISRDRTNSSHQRGDVDTVMESIPEASKIDA